MRRSMTFGIAVAILLAASAAAAQSQTIYACIKVNNGQARLVGATEKCGPSEKPMSWSVDGKTGPAGPQGPQGAKGDPGDAGSASPIRVEDANGHYVGDFAGGTMYYQDWFTLVTRKVENTALAFAFMLKGSYVGGFPWWNGYETVWYLDDVCQQPAVMVDPESSTTWGVGKVDATTGVTSVYYPVGPAAVRHVYDWVPAGGYNDPETWVWIPVDAYCRDQSRYGYYAPAASITLGVVTRPYQFVR